MNRSKPDDSVLREAWDAAGGNVSKAALIMTSMTREKVTRHMARHWYAGWEIDPDNQEAVEDEEDQRPIYAGIISSPMDRMGQLTGKAFVFTMAQNNTEVHPGFVSTLEKFCELENAQFIVGTTTYNKSGFQNSTKKDEDLWYDPRIQPYILNRSVKVADSLVWSGELNVRVTAVNPLSGMENYTQGNAMIMPHSKVRYVSVPTMPPMRPKVMFTTGACTMRNYIEMKAGQKASHHHTFAALFVEIAEDGTWFARQLIADKNGHFNDLDHRYTETGKVKERVAAINWGDLHVEKMDQVVAATGLGIYRNPKGKWEYRPGMGSLTEMLNPHWQFAHDTSDFQPRNHHNIKDHQFIFETLCSSRGNVEGALLDCSDFLAEMASGDRNVAVVASNHDGALDTWLKTADYREDPENALYFLKLQRWVYLSLAAGGRINIFKEALTALNPKMSALKFLAVDESFKLLEIEMGMHGHLGANGARGTPLALSKLGLKANTGHTHTPCIIDGLFVSGLTGELDQGYNSGLSSWSHTHTITFLSGKRQLVTHAPDGRTRA